MILTYLERLVGLDGLFWRPTGGSSSLASAFCSCAPLLWSTSWLSCWKPRPLRDLRVRAGRFYASWLWLLENFSYWSCAIALAAIETKNCCAPTSAPCTPIGSDSPSNSPCPGETLGDPPRNMKGPRVSRALRAMPEVNHQTCWPPSGVSVWCTSIAWQASSPAPIPKKLLV